jgi:hypothetical protein
LSLVTQFRRVERFWSRFLLRDDSKTGSLLAKFGWDILRVMEKYFARPDLPPEVRRIRAQARARLYEHAADRVIFGDFRAGRRLYLRALLAAPLSAPPSLARRVAYLYYRDSVFGRTYRGLKGRWA